MLLTGLFLFIWNSQCGADIQTYNMDDYCGSEINMILDSVYQLKLQLDDIYIFDRNLKSSVPFSCRTKIEPWYTWPNMMFYFESLDLDCNLGYLQFFQSTSNGTRVKGLEDDVCGDQKPNGVFTLESDRFLRITYVPKRSQYVEDAVSIIITSYASAPCPVHGFKCDNSRCIDRDIRCGGYDSCGDESGCKFDLSSIAIAGIIISSAVGLFILIFMVICIFCCMRKKQKSQDRVQNPSQHGFVNTATRNCPVTFSPPAYSSSQCDQPSTLGVSFSNQGPHQASASQSQALPLNVTAGQKPAYPANWTMQPYHQNYFRNPPAYEEINGDAAVENSSSGQENATVYEALETVATDESEENNGRENDAENNDSNVDQADAERPIDATNSPDLAINESKNEIASDGDVIASTNDESEADEAIEVIENKTNELMITNAEPARKVMTDCNSSRSKSDINTD